jgi:hypothetical protein
MIHRNERIQILSFSVGDEVILSMTRLDSGIKDSEDELKLRGINMSLPETEEDNSGKR